MRKLSLNNLDTWTHYTLVLEYIVIIVNMILMKNKLQINYNNNTLQSKHLILVSKLNYNHNMIKHV